MGASSSCDGDSISSSAPHAGDGDILLRCEQQLRSFVESQVAALGASQALSVLADGAAVQAAVLRHALVSKLLPDVAGRELAWEVQDFLEQQLLASDGCVEALMLSGGCCNWPGAIELLCNIHALDPACLADDMRIRLASAVALCFAEGETDSNMHGQPIDPLVRYHQFCLWAETGQLFPEFWSLRAWQLRYVVGSWHSDDCLEWARAHVNPAVRSPELIGQSSRMVSYRLHNASGVSVQDGLRFYDGKKSTMPVILEYGGVCGAVSKFGASACQSFGVPAMPVAQPGHCAMIWRGPGGKWTMENGNAGMAASTMHKGIQRTWRSLGSDSAVVIPVMEQAQASFRDYAASEAVRLAAPWCCGDDRTDELHSTMLAEAVRRCPHNLPAWADLLGLRGSSATRTRVLRSYAAGAERKLRNLARFRPVAATSDEGRAPNLVDGTSSEWFPTSAEPQQIVVDLQHPSKIESVRIQWWGDYGKRTALRLSSSADGADVVPRGERTSDAAFNGWTTLPGWDGETRFVRLDLSNPGPDCFGLNKQYGLRQLEVLGHSDPLDAHDEAPAVLAAQWAELLFSAPSQADALALGFVKRMAGAPDDAPSEASPCCIS